MATEDTGEREPAPGGGAADTVRLLTRPIAAALVGRAEPAPARRPWPGWLRWTRAIGVGRLPFAAVAQLVDVLVAVGLMAGTYSLLCTEVPERAPGTPEPLLLAASAALTLPIVLRERHPLGAWRLVVVAMAVTGPQGWLTIPYVPGGTFASMLCLYTVASRGPREATVGVGVLSSAGVLVLDRSSGFVAILLILPPLLVGHLVRQRRLARRELAEQERRHQDAEAVLMERQRIARELHDVVAHHMSMIAIQAEAAPYTVPEMPDKIRKDLGEIRGTALDALTEMRRILGVLRSADGAETAPQPSLDRIDELLAGARGTGLEVTARIGEDVSGLPPGLGLTAYRILQEALSNAMRHAPGSRVDVAIGRDGGVLRLEIVNGPPGEGHRPTPSPPGGGHGLVGMRERAAMLDGVLTAGPTSEGGFAVIAALPEAGPGDAAGGRP
ncbi:sensor histidine kinase [Actinomadura viridis]|uniref:sensor histidine kinase n=1 Tax=Actinomadura viridis TaxID=58110 RepID=UPI0036797CF4